MQRTLQTALLILQVPGSQENAVTHTKGTGGCTYLLLNLSYTVATFCSTIWWLLVDFDSLCTVTYCTCMN